MHSERFGHVCQKLKIGYVGKVTQNVGEMKLMHVSRQNESRRNQGLK